MDVSLIQYLSKNYGLDVVDMVRQGGISNESYKLETKQGVFLLRIHSVDDKELLQIQFEMDLLSKLSDVDNIKFQEPFRNSINGGLISIYGARYITILTWIEGSLLPTIDAASEEQLEEIGKTVALLHIALKNTSISKTGNRVFDEAFFLQKMDFFRKHISKTNLSESISSHFILKIEILINELKTFINKKENIQIIHGDLHSGNYVMNDDKVSIIDFGYSGKGPYYYDLAQALMEINPVKHPAFLKGYAQVLPDCRIDMNVLNKFIGLAFLDTLSNLLINPKEYEFVESETGYALDFINRLG